jgi:hypothetical protein
MSKCSKNRELLWERETAFHEKGPLEPGDHPIRIHHTNSHRIDSTLDSYSTSILEMIHTRSNRSLVFATGTRFFLVIPPRIKSSQTHPGLVTKWQPEDKSHNIYYAIYGITAA